MLSEVLTSIELELLNYVFKFIPYWENNLTNQIISANIRREYLVSSYFVLFDVDSSCDRLILTFASLLKLL